MINWPDKVKLVECKYSKWYMQLIDNARDRILPEGTYTEKHHIIPNCMIKNNDKVALTAREHYIAHALLWKMKFTLQWHNKMMMALHVMVNGSGTNKQIRDYVVNSKIFAANRIKWSQMMSETRKGENNHFYGKKHTDETRQKIVDSNKRTKYIRSEKAKGDKNPMWGKKHTAEQIKQISIGVSAHWTEENRKHQSEALSTYYSTDEAKAMASARNKARWENTALEERKRIGRKTADTRKLNGYKHSTETKKHMSEAAKNRPKKQCPHCSRTIVTGQYDRWHGENCKLNI